MAHSPADLEVSQDADQVGERGTGVFRRCRGRPRLTDSDRARRRLESRKKYDVRRVYLGESHKLWSELRRKTGQSDAGLAEHLILLYSTSGEKCQRKNCGRKTATEDSAHQKRDGRERVSSLQSLVCWHQEHSASCPHEPHLRALVHQPDSSTAALWQCESKHSFTQYLFPPQTEPCDSDPEEGVDREGNGQNTSLTAAPKAKSTVSRRRQRTAHKQTKDFEENTDVSNVHHEAPGGIEQIPPPCPDRSRDVAETEQPFWDMEGSPGAAYHSEEDCEDPRPPGDNDLQRLGGNELTEPHGYQCVSASLEDKQESVLNGSVPPQMQNESELFDPLQTVVTSCELPDQRTALEGPQLIIITGPSYEALASEGIQLNMTNGANMEEVTCTVIGNVTYNQVCPTDAKVRTQEEDSITDFSDKQLLEPAVDPLELSTDMEPPRSVSRSRRSRRGPMVEADGMLKMFHCPYEGCSQVYVAISSFQNHVNLVHRKGRTKVCPHPGCGKKFYLSNHLHRHMIIHSGVRDFICETCGKSFKRKNHLEVHRRTHTGETPLQCEICGYQCRQRASLNWHMKKHTPEAHYNFTCEFCNKRFEKLDSVKFHKLKSHPDKLAA